MKSYRVRYRSFASYDDNTPLMYIPIQETCIQAGSPEAASAEVLSTRPFNGTIDIISVEVDEHWTRYHDDLRKKAEAAKGAAM